MAVAFDAKPTAWNSADGLNQQTDNGTSCSASTGFAIGASANLLVAVITYQATLTDPGAISAWTWGGVARTGLVEVFNNGAAAKERTAIAWWLNPATGTNTLTASWPNTADAYMSCASFSGANTSTPVVTADNVTVTAGTTVTVASDANDATVAAWGTNGSTPTVNFNKIYAQAPLDPCGAATYQLGGTSNAHTFTGGGGSTPAGVGIHIMAEPASAADLGLPGNRIYSTKTFDAGGLRE